MTKLLSTIIIGCILVFASLTAIISFCLNYKSIDHNSQIVLVESECERITSMGFNPIPLNQDSCLLAPAGVMHTGFSNPHVIHVKAANKAGQMMLLTITPQSVLAASEGYFNSLF